MSAADKPWFCSISSGQISVCSSLDEVLEFPNGRGTKHQGLKLYSMVNMTTMDFSRNLIVLKSGKHGKKGLVINFCPFCRSELVEGSLERLNKVKEKESALAAQGVQQ